MSAALSVNPAKGEIPRMKETRNPVTVFSGGFAIGTLGGLIGLGGAEFRLPLLIGLFGFAALPAIILNKAMSLVVVAASIPFRTTAVPFSSVLDRWDVIITLLAGSLIGAWVGAGWATKIESKLLYKILAGLLVLIAAALFWGHDLNPANSLSLNGYILVVVGIVAGFFIGVVASVMGVAGGELLIPAIILLFGVDIKLAGSLSLAVSLPTMIIGFARYSKDQSFKIIAEQYRFLWIMAVGSIAGAFVGGMLLTIVASSIILPLLTGILLISAYKVWRHSYDT